jgi:hypothetical protein
VLASTSPYAGALAGSAVVGSTLTAGCAFSIEFGAVIVTLVSLLVVPVSDPKKVYPAANSATVANAATKYLVDFCMINITPLFFRKIKRRPAFPAFSNSHDRQAF